LYVEVARLYSWFNSIVWRYGSGEAWIGSMTGEEEVTQDNEEGGTEEEGIEEEGEEGATLQYVINDLPMELYIELMEGFHK
jgi:hypothetical protein